MLFRAVATASIALLLLCSPANAEKILIAQAANFMLPLQEIIPLFEAKTGVKVEAVYSSSGKFYTQIINGAPFDIFMSADEARPQRLYKEGKAETPFIYAQGSVVLWIPKKDVTCSTWTQCIEGKTLQSIAIANPETAPYGTTAMKALEATGLVDSVTPRLVYAQSIGQAFQFVSSGAADAGFCALSSTFSPQGQKGTTLRMPEAPPVIQAGCILSNAPNSKEAHAFVDFMNTPEVAAIKARYGYK